MRLITPGGRSARSKGLQEGGGKLFVGTMPRANARFRVSIKDNKTRRGIKVELIEAPGRWDERRYRLRLNGREPDHVKGEPSWGQVETTGVVSRKGGSLRQRPPRTISRARTRGDDCSRHG